MTKSNSIPIDAKKPVKIGNSFYFSIPRVYINNKIIDKDKKYNLNATQSS